jgi:hypothetical protein
MAKKVLKRTYRDATAAERKRHAAIRKEIASELPEIKEKARRRLASLRKKGTPLRHVMGVLRAERERLGLSLADIYERSGIDRAALSRLENDTESNPTLTTLERYAAAVGRKMVVLLSEASK